MSKRKGTPSAEFIAWSAGCHTVTLSPYFSSLNLSSQLVDCTAVVPRRLMVMYMKLWEYVTDQQSDRQTLVSFGAVHNDCLNTFHSVRTLLLMSTAVMMRQQRMIRRQTETAVPGNVNHQLIPVFSATITNQSMLSRC